MPITSRQEDAARRKYRQSPKGREAARAYSRYYYHHKLKHDSREREVRRRANRANYYMEHYGISPEKADELKAAGCDLCGAVSGKLNIDHKHGERGVRGVLCNPCNLMIGWIELAEAKMPTIMEYVRRPNRAVE